MTGFVLPSWRKQAFSQVCAFPSPFCLLMSEMGILQHLRSATLTPGLIKQTDGVEPPDNRAGAAVPTRAQTFESPNLKD
jgi:hypothetical protein